jgi:hypothetical protein
VAEKLTHTAGVLALILAGLVLWHARVQWLREDPSDDRISPASIREQLRIRQDPGRDEGPRPGLLVEQAMAYARCLNPPRQAAAAPSPPVMAAPVARPISPTPPFRLAAISYYRSDPERSLAMVSDAGRSSYWVRRGDHVGPFVVERIEKQTITYRNGDQVAQMALVAREPVPLGRLKPRETLVSVSK